MAIPKMVTDATQGELKASGKIDSSTLKVISGSLFGDEGLDVLKIASGFCDRSMASFVYVANHGGEMYLYTNINNNNDVEVAVNKVAYYKDSTQAVNKILEPYKGITDLLMVEEFDEASSPDL